MALIRVKFLRSNVHTRIALNDVGTWLLTHRLLVQFDWMNYFPAL